MKRKIFYIGTAFFLMCGNFSPVFAIKVYPQNANSIKVKKVKDPSRLTILNKTTDFFATVGKSEKEREFILQNRRRSRKEYRLLRESEKKKAKTQKRMRNQQKIITGKIKLINEKK